MSKQRKNYPLRLPNDLFDEIKRWAESEMRSVNGQIEFVLRQAVNNRKGNQSASADSVDQNDASLGSSPTEN